MDPKSGGPAQGVKISVNAMKAAGIENEVVSLDDPNADFLQSVEIPVTALGPATGPWQKNSNLTNWLLKNLLSFQAVIVHGLWLYPGFAVRKVLMKFSAEGPVPPLFYMPHGMLDPYFQKASDRRLKALRNSLYWKIIEAKNIHAAHGLLFTCEEELLLARQTFRPYKPTGEYNIGYGIEPPPPASSEMHTAFFATCPEVQEVPFILFISRVHPKKGVDLLLKAYAGSCAKRAPHLVIAGPGMETEYGQLLREMTTRLGIQDRVHYCGMLQGPAKWGAFYNSEAFILPSHQENFGIAVAEALSCGKPVLISDKVNIWREIEAGGAGFVATDTVAGTADLLERWNALSAPEKEDMSAKAKATWKQYFSISENIGKLVKVLEDSISQSQNRVKSRQTRSANAN